jgi:hypothetical protein
MASGGFFVDPKSHLVLPTTHCSRPPISNQQPANIFTTMVFEFQTYDDGWQ